MINPLFPKSMTALCFVFALGACAPHYVCSTYSKPLPQANAGCFVAREGKLLVAQQRTGLWNLPGGTAEAGESAQCTAERETFEETGVKVEVGELLEVFDNGFHLFACTSRDQQVLLKAQDKVEVQDLGWIHYADFDKYPWRFPEQMNSMRERLRALE